MLKRLAGKLQSEEDVKFCDDDTRWLASDLQSFVEYKTTEEFNIFGKYFKK